MVQKVVQKSLAKVNKQTFFVFFPYRESHLFLLMFLSTRIHFLELEVRIINYVNKRSEVIGMAHPPTG